ncbi:MAG: DALR domain-containing protein, partial [Pseudomonadota bacterium]
VHDLLEQGVPGEVIRFVFLQTHYRKPMDWTEKKAREAETTLRKWRVLTAGIEPAASAAPEVVAALSDDLNTAGALSELHRLAVNGEAAELLVSAQVLGLLTGDMGAWADTASVDLTSHADRLADARASAMQNKDFSEVDRLKAAYLAAGLEVRMSKEGVELVPGAGFDAVKLENV